ncbi:MAG TPA: dihydrolipoamide acetyltransferase family protein [Verrucomicrobiales bacterium]|nr:dihydrolipoamide acetyltransferase family protein [Verrucomicrobiales bacterium]
MAVNVDMPKLSDTMTEGILVKWLKKQGDRVDIGDVIAEIETDKATMEMEAFDEGVLGEIYVQEGEKVPVGGRIAVLLDEGEAPSSEAPEKRSEETEQPEPSAETTPGKKAREETGPAPVEPAPKKGPSAESGRIKASPLARKIAEERGVDLSSLQGTGPGGRVVRRDVLQAHSRDPGTPAPAAPTADPPKAAPVIRPSAGEGDQRIPLSGMRAIIAERLLASKTQIPHFYLHVDVDAAPLMAFRKELNSGNEDKPEANSYTVNDFILRAVVQSSLAVPEVNASFDGDAIVRFADVNLSVAVALEEGLVTPVIRKAQEKSLPQLSLAVKDLAARARSKKLAPDEFQGGTVTVSNLGAYGIRSFDAIINPPQCLIIAVGAIGAAPVVAADGAIVAGLRMDLGLSGDHRVIDGAVGARFLAEMKRLLEHPPLMLL